MAQEHAPYDLLGHLQLRIMDYLWTVSAATVQDTMIAVNAAAPDLPPRPYTTFLSVMRNLAKRRLLDQRRTDTKRHLFVAMVDATAYKSVLLRQVFRDYCNSDLATLHRYLDVAVVGSGHHDAVAR